MRFECESCKQNFNYENSEEHLRGCLKVACPLKCCEEKKFTQIEEFKDHLRLECPKMGVICGLCNKRYVREKEHTCVGT